MITLVFQCEDCARVQIFRKIGILVDGYVLDPDECARCGPGGSMKLLFFLEDPE